MCLIVRWLKKVYNASFTAATQPDIQACPVGVDSYDDRIKDISDIPIDLLRRKHQAKSFEYIKVLGFFKRTTF